MRLDYRMGRSIRCDFSTFRGWGLRMGDALWLGLFGMTLGAVLGAVIGAGLAGGLLISVLVGACLGGLGAGTFFAVTKG